MGGARLEHPTETSSINNTRNTLQTKNADAIVLIEILSHR